MRQKTVKNLFAKEMVLKAKVLVAIVMFSACVLLFTLLFPINRLNFIHVRLPEKTAFEFSMNIPKSDYSVGDVVEIEASVKSNVWFSYLIQQGETLFRITLTKEGEEESSVLLGKEAYLCSRGAIREKKSFLVSEPGKYELRIYGMFSISTSEDKQGYEFSDKKMIIVD